MLASLPTELVELIASHLSLPDFRLLRLCVAEDNLLRVIYIHNAQVTVGLDVENSDEVASDHDRCIDCLGLDACDEKVCMMSSVVRCENVDILI